MSDRDRRVGLTGARFGRVARDDGTDPPAEPAAPEPVAPPPAPPPVAPPPALAELPPAMPAGARFGGSRKERKAREAAVAAARAEAKAAAEAAARAEQAEAERIAAYQAQQPEPAEPEVDGDDPSIRVRPYIHTGGRTRSRLPLPMESLVTASRDTSPLALQDSHRAVFELCRVTQSVAEVSAKLGIPLGVARVLIDDLAAANAITVYGDLTGDSPDILLMERVLAGLRRL